MGSESPLKLPIIHFSELGLKPGTTEWDSVKSQVYQALNEYGCFEALFEKIPQDLQKNVFSSLETLFDLPLETKLKNVSEKPYYGYIGQIPLVPLYESMGIDNVPTKAKSFTEIFWPEGNHLFSDTMESFSTRLIELELVVRRMVLEMLGVVKYYNEYKESTNYLLRVMKYKGPQTTETPHIGLASHTDKNIVTVLYQNQVDGLEVQTENGEWIKYNRVSTDSFVVMTGETFHAWTNGRVYSPKHRVMMKGNETRYSLGLFSIPKEGYLIKAPKELVDEKHPLLFKPFEYAKYREFFFTEAGQRVENALKTYCGV